MSNFTEFVCVANEVKWTYILLMPLPLIAGSINVIVWLAATFYRKKLLRQSYVYTCVTSTLLSNTLYLAFHLWEEVAGYMMPAEMSIMKPSDSMKLIWTICTSASVSMLFVLCGNLSVLIFVMLDSTYFQKSVRQRITSNSSLRPNNKVMTTSALEAKRRRAAFLVAFTWLIPLGLTIAAVLTWNCSDHCHCSPGAIGDICPPEKDCSRMWMPMTNSFIAVNVILWFLEVISLIYVTISGIKNFRNYHARSSSRYRSSNIQLSLSLNKFPEKEDIDDKSAEKDDLKKSTESETSAPRSESNAASKKQKRVKDDVFTPARRRFLFKNPRLRLVSYLSIIFIVCTVMIPVAFFVDISVTRYNILGLRIASLVLVQIYTLLCPILLVKYMSNLKTAVVRMASAILFCFK